jgi:hypothetical protein
MRSITCGPTCLTSGRLWLSVVVLLSTANSISLTPAMFLSSKTPYYPQQQYSTYEAMPPHCKLVHINHMARHGSRHSTKLKGAVDLLDTLSAALRIGKLKEAGSEALRWSAQYLESERTQLGKPDALLMFTLCYHGPLKSPPYNACRTINARWQS